MVHDLVDFVSAEGEKAGKSAAAYLKNGVIQKGDWILVKNGSGVGYPVPQRISKDCKNACHGIFPGESVFQTVKITISNENGERMTFKRERMAPGEMERIVAFADKLKDCKVITVRGAGGCGTGGCIMRERTCIVCPKGCTLHVDEKTFHVSGNSVARGAEYGAQEVRDPRRTLTTTVILEGAARKRLPVKTDRTIQKAMMGLCRSDDGML
jgi:hypothetical protein